MMKKIVEAYYKRKIESELKSLYRKYVKRCHEMLVEPDSFEEFRWILMRWEEDPETYLEFMIAKGEACRNEF